MNGLNVVSYLGTDYLCRTVYEPDGGRCWCMADEQLGKRLADDIGSSNEVLRGKALYVDENFYCYVPLSVLIQPEKDILKWCADNGIDL